MAADGRGRARLREALDGVRDLERLAGRAAAGRATPRELGALRDSFRRLPDVLEALAGLADRGRSAALGRAGGGVRSPRRPRRGARRRPRGPAARPSLADGGVIRAGYDPELDELRDLRDGGKQYIAALQQRERERTGIPSLKVGFNKVFGYYLEITNAHAGQVPADYERRQTLAERRALRHPRAQGVRGQGPRRGGADRDPRGRAVRGAPRPGRRRRSRGSSAPPARSPGSTSGPRWPRSRSQDRYVRPEVHDGFDLALRQSRHPVIERMMPREAFIPNDVRFDEAERVLLVTGPNMAGKSTILRQIGLCVVLAQMGAFVPADGGPRSAWWTGSSPGSAPATTWRGASPPSWWR